MNKSLVWLPNFGHCSFVENRKELVAVFQKAALVKSCRHFRQICLRAAAAEKKTCLPNYANTAFGNYKRISRKVLSFFQELLVRWGGCPAAGCGCCNPEYQNILATNITKNPIFQISSSHNARGGKSNIDFSSFMFFGR